MATALASSLRTVHLSSDVCRDWKVVAAIDFGTSNSGYAFAFRDSGPVNASSIQLNKWQMDVASSATEKAPTTVLLNPDKTFDSFGYKAESKFARLCDQKKDKGWWYFQRFKMVLHDRKLSRDDQLFDVEGKGLPAIHVFSTGIRHLKDQHHMNSDLLKVVQLATSLIIDEIQVGINDEQLNLVLEPEAASVYCRQTKCRIVREPGGVTKRESLGIGQKYIILDIGGGTADIASHEILDNEKLCELNNTRGNNVAGQKFNSNLLEVLYDLFGKELFCNWQKSKTSDYLELQRAIDGCKREDISSNEGVYIRIPLSFAMFYGKRSVIPLEQAVLNSQYRYMVEVSDDWQLHITADLLRSLFDSILKELIMHVDKIVKESPGIGTIFLVGGLSKSMYICQFIQRKFPQVKIVVPEDPGVAVLKGAVMLGERPQTIASRLARYSYGVRVNRDFVKGEHKEEYKFTRDGEELCRHIFDKLIEKGTMLKYGDTFETRTTINARMSETKQLVFDTPLYQSEQPSPMYTTENGCKCIGTIRKHPPEGGWPDYCETKVSIVVGEAEFKFYVKNDIGQEYETKVDFIGASSG